jgi:hypothetical protein
MGELILAVMTVLSMFAILFNIIAVQAKHIRRLQSEIRALEKAATFYEWQGKHYLSYDVPENDGFDVIESTDPRATIDELIAGEKK